MKLGLTTKGLALVSIPLLFQIGLMAVLLSIQTESEELTKRIQRSLETRFTLAVGMEKLTTLMYKDRKKMHFDMLLVSEVSEIRREWLQMVEKLGQQLRNNPHGMEVVDEMRRADKECERIIANAEETALSGDLTPRQEQQLAMTLRTVMRTAMKNAEKAIELLNQSQSDIDTWITAARNADRQYKDTLLYGSIAELALIVLSISLFQTDIINRMKIVIDNCYRLAALKPLHKPVGGTDEIADIDRQYHALFESLDALTSRERVLLENAATGIFALDEKLSFISANQATKNFFGVPAQELLGDKLANFLIQSEAQSSLAQFESRRSAEGGPFEIRIQNASKGCLETVWNARWQPNEKVFSCVVYDNEKRKETERKRHTLIRLVTDEIRRPLNSIAELLHKLKTDSGSRLSERGQNLLSSASLSSDQMVRLLGDLIEIERMESGTLELNRSSIALLPLLEQAATSINTVSKKREVTVEIAPGINYSIFADQDRVMQILINILSNAIKFSSKQSKVLISASADGDHVAISISDSGRGIPESSLETIFDPFKQAELADSREKGGTGLGLAICKALVNAHGGDISATSKEGVGTTFTFTIPLEEAREDD